ncbi:hypothetical protein, partial [Burkholderia sp. Ac-20379]|uniref:hypothetical protein n=1 Tax=Burkholderia sp. Ac-20379 TaxID=2703900 RepID=UPI00403F2EC5
MPPENRRAGDGRRARFFRPVSRRRASRAGVPTLRPPSCRAAAMTDASALISTAYSRYLARAAAARPKLAGRIA